MLKGLKFQRAPSRLTNIMRWMFHDHRILPKFYSPMRPDQEDNWPESERGVGGRVIQMTKLYELTISEAADPRCDKRKSPSIEFNAGGHLELHPRRLCRAPRLPYDPLRRRRNSEEADRFVLPVENAFPHRPATRPPRYTKTSKISPPPAASRMLSKHFKPISAMPIAPWNAFTNETASVWASTTGRI